MQVNKIYNEDCFKTFERIKNNSLDLCIIDPPYFKIKGEFDFNLTFEEWQNLHDKLAIELKRTLKETGTVFLFGHALRIAYQQIIFDKYFNLENSLVWQKLVCQTRRGLENYRKYAPVTERLLMYSKEINRTGLEKIKLDINNFTGLRAYFKELQETIGLNKSEIIRRIGQNADHCFRHSSSQWDLPTRETYEQILKEFNINSKEYEELRKEYEERRIEYEEQRRYFNNVGKYTDVLTFDQETNITGKYNHPTQKPPKLINSLIQCTTRKDDLIYIPFAGSGVDCEQAALLKRRYIASEINENYYNIAVERANIEERAIKEKVIKQKKTQQNKKQLNLF